MRIPILLLISFLSPGTPLGLRSDLGLRYLQGTDDTNDTKLASLVENMKVELARYEELLAKVKEEEKIKNENLKEEKIKDEIKDEIKENSKDEKIKESKIKEEKDEKMIKAEKVKEEFNWNPFRPSVLSPKMPAADTGSLNRNYPSPAPTFENFQPLTGDWSVLPMNSTQYGYDCLSAIVDPEFALPGWDDAYCRQMCLNYCYDHPMTVQDAVWPQHKQVYQMSKCMLLNDLKPCMVPFGLYHVNSGIVYSECASQAQGFNLEFTPGKFDVIDSSRVTRAHIILEGASCADGSIATMAHYHLKEEDCGHQSSSSDPIFDMVMATLPDGLVALDATDAMKTMGLIDKYYFQKQKSDSIKNSALTGVYSENCPVTGAHTANDSVIFEFTSWIHGLDSKCSTSNICSECHRHGCDWCQMDLPLEANPETKKMALVAFHNGQPDGSGCGIAETECIVLQGRFFKAEPDLDGISHCPSGPIKALGNPWRMMTHVASPRIKPQVETDIDGREDFVN